MIDDTCGYLWQWHNTDINSYIDDAINRFKQDCYVILAGNSSIIGDYQFLGICRLPQAHADFVNDLLVKKFHFVRIIAYYQIPFGALNLSMIDNYIKKIIIKTLDR